jgi:uncharacterized cupin superfamily protein
MSLQAGAKQFQGVLLRSGTSVDDFHLVTVDAASLPPEEVIGFRIEGNPEMAARTVWVSDDRCTAMNIEKCGPCKVIGTHFTEVFYLLAGRWTAKRPDGTEYEVKAGDFVCFAEGQAEECTVHETFVKFALYHATRPLPYEVTP